MNIYQIDRIQEWEKLVLQIRDNKDTLIISPPSTGLSSFLAYAIDKVKVSEAMAGFTPVYVKFNKPKDVISELCQKVSFSFSPILPKYLNVDGRLQDRFLKLLSKKRKLRLAVFIDDIQALQKEDIKLLFEHIRGLSQSRLDYPSLNNVVFIVAGHSINLGELDPKYISPFNSAKIIYLNDFQETDSVCLVNKLLPLDKYNYSNLVAKYIHAISSGHPYIINLICNHAKSSAGFQESIDFEKIDYSVDLIARDLRDPFIKGVVESLGTLEVHEKETLRKILNGSKYSANKTSPSLEKLELLGLATRQAGLFWRLRNLVFDRLISHNWDVKRVIQRNQFTPRRLFINLEAYKLIYDLENDLRDFVVAQMYVKYGDLWLSSIDPSIQGKWTGMRKSEKSGNRFSDEEYPLISYSFFSDVHEVISSQWKQIFYAYFKPQRIFTGYFNALEILRNKIAHNRPLRDNEFEQLKAIAERFRSCMLQE